MQEVQGETERHLGIGEFGPVVERPVRAKLLLCNTVLCNKFHERKMSYANDGSSQIGWRSQIWLIT